MNSVSSYFVGVPGGLVMSLIAFSIVFIVVTGLMLIMMGLHVACVAMEGKKTKAAAPSSQSSSGNAAPAAASKAVISMPDEDSGVLLAVLSAAVTATCGAAARVISYAPVSIKAPVASGWKIMSRMNNTQSFED
jgi:hypothetical protein